MNAQVRYSSSGHTLSGIADGKAEIRGGRQLPMSILRELCGNVHDSGSGRKNDFPILGVHSPVLFYVIRPPEESSMNMGVRSTSRKQGSCRISEWSLKCFCIGFKHQRCGPYQPRPAALVLRTKKKKPYLIPPTARPQDQKVLGPSGGGW